MFRDSVPGELPVIHYEDADGPFLVGAAAVDISPDESGLDMGGFSWSRDSTGNHDPLYARVIVLKRRDLELAIVALDLVGVMRPEILKFFDGHPEFDPARIIVASTHDHASPDSMGMWGGLFRTGIHRPFMDKVGRGVREAITQARNTAVPAEIASGRIAIDPKDFIKNANRPGLVDPEVVVLHARKCSDHSTIATLTELGCHPEAVPRWNTLVSADFPGCAVKRIEAELHGTGIYVSGALGALVSPSVERDRDQPEMGWQEAERIGNRLADCTLRVVNGLTSYDAAPELASWRDRVFLKNENWLYDFARWTGMVDRKVYGSDYVETDVNLLRVGNDLTIATIPGELSPDLGLRVKEFCGGTTMVIGLANDELGYLFPEWDYDLPLYDYERKLCVGRNSSAILLEHLHDLALLARYCR
jgi:neutral/alkaline ceramidase-like enzyme